ncbi:MAG TPA: phosphotransferase [Acidimicrobiales bacterium]|nr:phosphotransferase [Acidimicrobiales bacterium]
MTDPESVPALIGGPAGTRLDWELVPLAVRSSIEAHLGMRVARARTQPLGLSPALAARLQLADGSRAFVKAIGPDSESGAPGGRDFYRREARIAAALPRSATIARLIDSWEDHGWVALLFEDVDGESPHLPWRELELRSVLEAITALSVALTPSPIEVRRAGDAFHGRAHWAELTAEPQLLEPFAALDPWVVANLERFAGIEQGFSEATRGDSLLHLDIRADNILLCSDRVVFVDWPHAAVGAPWIDLVYFLPSVAMQGGPDIDELFSSHPLADGADRDRVVTVLTVLAGFFLRGATEPPPPGLPTLRSFQWAQAVEALRWLRHMDG